MYYITNQKNQIISIDEAFLKLLGFDTIENLQKKIAREEFSFVSATPDELIVKTDNGQLVFECETTTLSSMFGDLSLHTIKSKEGESIESEDSKLADEALAAALRAEEEREALISLTPAEEETEEDQTSHEALITLDNEPFSIIEDEEETAPAEESALSALEEEKEAEEPMISLDDEPFLLIDDEEETAPAEESALSALEEEKEAEEPMISLDNEPFSIAEEEKEIAPVEDTAVSTIDQTEGEKEEMLVENALSDKNTELTPILINVEEVSRTIGISAEDYTSFLNEFIDESIGLEKDLQSIDLQKQSDAIHTLKQLSSVLHLAEIADAIHKIEESTSEEKVGQIEILYNTLARLTTHSTESDFVAPDTSVEKEISVEEPLISIEEEDTEEELPEGSFGLLTIKELDEVKPIHFDFRLEEAAEELSLPVELIEEFVNDFLVQAREETVNMLAAYKEGNLDRVQKIGHLLKGASSNLRINPLADTLYEIQFCEDPSQLGNLIKNYWAHFISFETQMKLTSK